MKVECVPLTSFAHDTIDAHEGKVLLIEKGLADDLERAGLVRVKRPRVTPAQVQNDAGKAPDGGEGQPSSVSPAAPASPTPTLPAFGRGGKKVKRGA